jgi:hypothetical protein
MRSRLVGHRVHIHLVSDLGDLPSLDYLVSPSPGALQPKGPHMTGIACLGRYLEVEALTLKAQHLIDLAYGEQVTYSEHHTGASGHL